MIEHRLSEPFFDTQQNQIESCEAWEADNSSFSQTVRALSDWFCGHVREGQPSEIMRKNFGEGLREILETLPRKDLPSATLSSTEDGDMARGIDALITRQNGASPHAEWLLGTALAEACTQRPKDVITLATAWVIVQQYAMTLRAFQRTLLRHDLSDITETINDIIDIIAEEPAHFIYAIDQAQFPLALESFQKIKSVAVVWNFERIFPSSRLACPFIGLANIVIEENPERFLQLLENYKIPGALEEELLQYKIYNDFEVLLNLLENSPIAFDGQTWNGKLVAAMILAEANNFIFKLHHHTLHASPEKHEMFLTSEAPKHLKQLFEALLKRDDGLALGLSWLSEYVRKSSISLSAHPQDNTLNDLVIDTCAKELSAQRPSLDQIQGILIMPPDQDRFFVPRMLDVLLTMCLIVFEGEPTTKSLDTLHAFYSDALDKNDLSLRSSLAGSALSWRDFNIAKIFVMRAEPAQAWNVIWNKDTLRERRRRRHYYRYTKETIVDNADTTHAHVGLAILDWLCSPEHANDNQAQSLWDDIFEGIFFEYITYTKDQYISFMANLFGRFPSIFDTQSTSKTRQKLFVLFSRFSGDVELLSVCCLGLHLNKFDLKTCCDEIQEQHSLNVRLEIQHYLDWVNRTGGKPIRNDLPMQIQTMLEKIS
ncbi:MAG: hypothetical protein COB46_02105 [Rhodospirillaceae bacterium]|nr:MAG: hypothetical protein COB46_02105 [Rhodospirillaceae bacterium]